MRHGLPWRQKGLIARSAALVYAYSQRRATLLAMRKRTIATDNRTLTWGHKADTGRSRQKTLVKPSMAHALMVKRPAFWMLGGIRKRGNMLPPMADMVRMSSVD